MDPIHLFDLAAKQARWLSTSQAVIAGNVSNASTPGYKAQSVRPFNEILDRTQLQLVSTDANHLEGAGGTSEASVTSVPGDSWETTDSGNSVSLEQEMIKAGEVHRGFSLNTSLVKAFHGMLMASVKS